MRTRLVVALFAALSFVVVSAGQAWAGERPGGSGGAFVDSEIRPQSPEKAGLVAEAEGRVVADLVRRILASGVW